MVILATVVAAARRWSVQAALGLAMPAMAATVAATVAATSAAAVGFGDPALPCLSQFEAAASPRLYGATVRPADGGRLHLVRAKDSAAPTCPSLAAQCRLPAYLVPGDQVLVSSADDAFACVNYAITPGKVTSGLVPTAALDLKSGTREALDSPSGFGGWATGHAEITISPGSGGDYVLLEGQASRGPPSYNSGEISGPAYLAPDGHADAGFTDAHYRGEQAASATPAAETASACRVRLRRYGRYLVVDDNDACGGMGVTFGGIYVKRSPAASGVPGR